MSEIIVLHVIARMNVGGTAKYIDDLVRNIPHSALATGYVQGSEIEVPNLDEKNTFRIKHLGRKISLLDDLRAGIELWRLLKVLEPEIVHTHTFKAGLIGRLVPGNFKRVHTFHGHLFGDQSFSRPEKLVVAVLEKFLAKRTNVLVSVGKKVGSELREAGIGKNGHWLSISPGVTRLDLIDKFAARRFLNLDTDSFLVGWMARMTSVKNPDLLLEVAKELPQVQFVMAGGGDMLEEIKLKITENIHVIGWVQAAMFWSAVDCAISTSDNEGMPIALIEAQLAGKVTIATNVGSNSEVVESGLTGLITGKDAKSIAMALESLIENPHAFKAMSLAALEISPKKFSMEIMIEKHITMYENLVALT